MVEQGLKRPARKKRTRVILIKRITLDAKKVAAEAHRPKTGALPESREKVPDCEILHKLFLKMNEKYFAH